ncbi:radical SAM protein, partial [Candidatus Geothermarchaeota archaeon]
MLRKCEFCGEEKEIAGILGICVDCIRNKWSQVKDLVYKAHAKVREKYGLSPTPPTSKRGIKCDLCSNECVIGEGESGYCGLRFNEGNRLVSFVDVNHALLYSYLDAHPTNCCSVWFCPAGTGAGYPKYAYTKGTEYGYYNLAV